MSREKCYEFLRTLQIQYSKLLVQDTLPTTVL